MKKHILLRFLGLFVLYISVLLLIGSIQFAEKGFFTRQAGGILVTGYYRSQDYPNQYTLAGRVNVAFGGIEFSLNDKEEGFALVKAKGTKERVLPESMTVTDETVTFAIPGGTRLDFAVTHVREKPELMISAVLGAGVLRIELPYKPLKNAKLQDLADGQLMILFEGMKYRFNRMLTNAEHRALIFQPQAGSIAYQIVPENEAPVFNPQEFIIPAAYDKQTYDKAVARWVEQNFSLWGKNIASTNNEDMVVAYLGEAVKRGNYISAVSSVPASFLNGSRRTYESCVFLDKLTEQGLRSLVTAERDTANRLTEIVSNQSLDFLKEPHIFEYFAVRGNQTLFNQAVDLLKTMKTDAVSTDYIIGILEGYADWNQYQRVLEQTNLSENPFEAYIAQVYLIIAQGLHKTPDGERVLVFFTDATDLEFNLRLGNGLTAYADNAGNPDWAAIGRSLILSALSLADDTGTISTTLLRSKDGTLQESPEALRFSSARLYRLLNTGENQPRAEYISPSQDGIWAWTAATELSITEDAAVLDIGVRFPVGETHYMLIRGTAQPKKLQLYDMDYRTAPNFEQYNSSGWFYSSAEQTLMIKMRHRSEFEHIRIFK